jgi:hypothetical protein
MNLQSPPYAPSPVAHELDATLDPDAYQTSDAAGILLESGLSKKSKKRHASGVVARVVVGHNVFDDIEGKVAELKSTFERHDAFDKDALVAAAGKRAWKCRQRVIRREMYLNRHLLTAMAKYVGTVKLPTRAEGDDFDGRHAAYVAHFSGEEVA